MRVHRLVPLSLGAIGLIGVTTAAALAAPVKWGSAVAAGGDVISISCASAGTCAAGGSNDDGAFVQDETGGVWATAIDVPGTAGGSVTSVSCAGAGNCAAGGNYADASAPGGRQAFLMDEQNGAWGNAIDVPGTAGGSVTSVSCGGAGNCAAVGVIDPVDISSQPQTYVVSETNGVWGDAISLKAFHHARSDVYSISCVSAGNCVAGGGYYNSATGAVGALFLREKNGAWGKVVKVRAPAGVTSISCVTATSCAAGGPGVVMSELHGVWRNAVATPHAGDVSSISCGSPGNCAAVGYYNVGAHGGLLYGWLKSSKNGKWGRGETVSGVMTGESSVRAVSCAGAGSCAAIGWYNYYGSHAFVVAAKNGVWGQAIDVPGVAAISPGGLSGGNSISCVKTGECVLGGAPAFVTAP